MTWKWDDSVALIDKVRTGCRESSNEVVVRFRKTVYGIALRKLHGNANDADEITQDVFMRAFAKIHQLRDSRCFTSWLKQITHSLVINRLSRRTHLDGATPVVENIIGNVKNPHDIMDDDETAANLRKIIAAMPKFDKDILNAFYMDGLSIVQISCSFKIPIGTVKRRLFTARIRLKRILTGEDRPVSHSVSTRRTVSNVPLECCPHLG